MAAGPPAVELGQHLERAAAGQVWIEPRFLDEAGHAVQTGRSPLEQRPAEDLDPPGIGTHQSEHEAQQRRLSRSVRAEQPTYLARLHLQVDSVEGVDGPEPLRQTPGRKRRGTQSRAGTGDGRGDRQATVAVSRGRD